MILMDLGTEGRKNRLIAISCKNCSKTTFSIWKIRYLMKYAFFIFKILFKKSRSTSNDLEGYGQESLHGQHWIAREKS